MTVIRLVAIHWPVLIPIAVLLGLSTALFPSAGRDDAYITYWAAYALGEFGEIVNLNGERLEQSSSLLHVIVLAVASWLTPLSVASAGPIVSLLSGVLTLVYTYRLAGLMVSRWYGVMATMIVATVAPFVYWSTGGLEGTLSALVATALVYYLIDPLHLSKSHKSKWAVIVVVPAYILVRPEGIFVLTALLIGTFTVVRARAILVESLERLEEYFLVLRRLLWWALVLIGSGVVIFGFRVLYFGSWFPQPVSGKEDVSGLFTELGGGFEYLVNAMVPPPISILPLFLLAGMILSVRDLIQDQNKFWASTTLTIFVGINFGFILFVGGDWMEGSRFVVPVIPIIAVLAISIVPKIPNGELRVYAVMGILVLNLVGVVWFAKFGSISTPIWEVARIETSTLPVENYSWYARPNRTHLRDIPVSERLNEIVGVLKRKVDGKVVVMSGQAGFVMFHVAKENYREIEFVDRHALTTDHFTECGSTRDIARTSIGLMLTYTAFIASEIDIEKDCGIPRPHVIFALDVPERTVETAVTSGDYTVVYGQTGRIKTGDTLEGIEVLAHEFIAVRDDLVDLFPEPLPEVRVWGE